MNNHKTLRLETKLPSSELFPNKKAFSHWTKTDKFKKLDQEAGFFAVKHTDKIFTFSDRLSMKISFIYSDNRHRDIDNMLAASKAIQDGIFSALKINDKQIDVVIIDKLQKDKINPRCIIELTVL